MSGAWNFTFNIGRATQRSFAELATTREDVAQTPVLPLWDSFLMWLLQQHGTEGGSSQSLALLGTCLMVRCSKATKPKTYLKDPTPVPGIAWQGLLPSSCPQTKTTRRRAA